MPSHAIEIGGQSGWYHDEGDAVGVFHTFDGFKVNENDKARKIHVFLPREYPLDGSIRFPVLYTNDGQDVFFSHDGSQSLQMAKVLNGVLEAIHNDKTGNSILQPIVVAVHADEDRDHEYNHEMIVEDVGGGLPAYTSYICDTLKAWIDKNYFTVTDSKDNSIMGTSHGGLAAFYIATRRPDCFGCCICMSPSFWAGMDSNHNNPMLGFVSIEESSLLNEVKDKLLSRAVRPRVYIDWGQCRDSDPQNLVTEAMVEKRGKEMATFLTETLQYREVPDAGDSEIMVVIDHMGGHNELAWNWRLHGALYWLLSGVVPTYSA